MAGKIEPVEFFENPIITKKGKERIIEWHNKILKNEQGKIYATLSSGLDITERKKVEEKLEHINLVLRAIRNVNQLITKEKDRRMLIQGVCDNLIETRGYFFAWIALIDDSNNVIQNAEADLGEFFFPIDKLLKKGELPKCIQIALTQSDVYIVEDPSLTCVECPLSILHEKKAIMVVRLRHNQKIFGWLSVSISRNEVKDEDEQKLFKEVANDIAFALYNIELEEERRKAEQKLKESEENYHQAFNRAEFYKDIFAHDINNLLQNIKSSMELLSTFKNIPEKSDEVNELTNIIEEQVVRGTKLVWNVRRLSQIEETESSLEPVEIFQVLKEAINFIQKSYHDKDMDIQIDSKIKQCFVQANELLLDLFENILFNAVKNNENPKVEISVKVSKVDKDRKKYLKFEFLDNGIGVPDALKDLLFKDISGIKRKKTKGMGLGLLLVSKILTIYDGQIWVEDKIKGDTSKGSNFIILLPEVI